MAIIGATLGGLRVEKMARIRHAKSQKPERSPARIQDTGFRISMFEDVVSTSGIQIDVIKTIPDFLHRRSEWDACVNSNDGDIYFSSTWLEVWWKHYGKNRSPLFVTAYSGDRCVACIPFYQEKFPVILGSARVIRLCGVHHDFPILRLPVELEVRAEVMASVFEFLRTETKCDAISFSPMSSLDATGEYIATNAGGFPGWRVARNDTPRTHSVSFLPDHPEAYFASLPSRERKNYRNRSRRLQEKMVLRDQVAGVEEGPAILRQIVRLQSDRMRHYGGSGTFEAWPGLERFYLDLIPELVPSSRMYLAIRYGDGTPICGQIGFRRRSTFYWHVTGRAIRDDLLHLGVGSVTSIDFTKSLVEQGIRQIEDAAGVFDYKERLGGETHDIRRLIFVRNVGPSELRCNILLLWMRALQFLYYGIWYLKVAPRISRMTGRRQRPLLWAWIATRL